MTDSRPAAELIAEECDRIKAMLIEKNLAYGNSALNPLRLFSKGDASEQLRVRIDDKLSRIQRGSEAGEDTVLDLIGYLILYRLAAGQAGAQPPVQDGPRPSWHPDDTCRCGHTRKDHYKRVCQKSACSCTGFIRDQCAVVPAQTPVPSAPDSTDMCTCGDMRARHLDTSGCTVVGCGCLAFESPGPQTGRVRDNL